VIYVPDIESIMVAYEALLKKTQSFAPFDSGTIPTVTRVWQPWEQVNQLAQPAIVIVEAGEKETDRRGQQSSLSLKLMLTCYIIVDPKDTDYPPNTRLNSFLSAIRTAHLPSGSDIVKNAQTLGGLVSNVFIDGNVVKDAGIIDSQGSILIPVTVLIT
jgi:hypothetical protein